MKKKTPFLLLIVCILSLSYPELSGADNQFLAGTAKVNITPADSKYPVHDSLYARSLVMDHGDVRIAIISIDLGGYNNPGLVKYCQEKYGIDQLMICPSHTHSGARDRETNTLEKQLIGVIDEAVNNMFPAKVAAGHRTFPQLGFNRLIIRDDGHAREAWYEDDHYGYINHERIPFGPVDPAVGVIKIEDLDGQARAIIMNYACHSDAVWGNYAVSADYPGVACRLVEEAFDKKANCLFIEGAAGNIAPLFKTPGRSGPDDPFQTDYSLIERMGKLLAIETVKLAESIYPNPREAADLKVISDSLKFTGRFNPAADFNIHILTILLNNSIAIATFPGEPFIKFQLDWKTEIEKADHVRPFFFGYTLTGGRWPGYVPDIRSAALGGYGADQGENMIEPGAGEKVMNKHLENFYVLNGLMRDKPGPVDSNHGIRYQVTPVEPIKQNP